MCSQFTSNRCGDLSEFWKLYLQVGKEHIFHRVLCRVGERNLMEIMQMVKPADVFSTLFGFIVRENSQDVPYLNGVDGEVDG